MTKYIVVVESPAKAKTIQKYLGKDYEVYASYGHVRQLPSKKGSVEPDNNFAMTYSVIEKNLPHINVIAKALKTADGLLLATDPDREGEAISWHIQEILRDRDLLAGKSVARIYFNEITKTAVCEALNAPRDVAMDLVNAQQARSALDYLVGFNLSPLLWRKIKAGLSAGRVQSPALRLIVEREEAIERFQSQEYWKILAQCHHHKVTFDARLTHIEDQKLKQFDINESTRAHSVRDAILKMAQGSLRVLAQEKKERKRKPAPPFITSTLQQEAVRKLGFTARKTMMVAQQLYEGIDIGAGTVGLITYMRTDSFNLSADAVQEMRDYIQKTYGSKNCPDKPRLYKAKSKNAQEAHEAIRPTSVVYAPDSIKSYLTADQFKLYHLIWKRAIASQMADAICDTVAVDLGCGGHYVFRANGSVVTFQGFLLVYEEGLDDIDPATENEVRLPVFTVGEAISLKDVLATQHFTEPPPRYTEATLVKALEEYDIGRPSTYASIIHTLQLRNYVVVDKKRFAPTDVGRIVNKFLTQYFTQYVDYQFTAALEDTLDAISRGEKAWLPVLDEYWKPFKHQVDLIDTEVKRKDVTTEVLSEKCPKCSRDLAIRLGKRGRFIGCTGYPDCDFTQPLPNADGETVETQVIEGRQCPECDAELHIKSGRYGRFIGCSRYPDCKHMEPLEKPADTGIICPKCKQANILKRKSRKGRIFYSCKAYPKCDYAIWNEPVEQACPQCAWPILTLKETKRLGRQYVCPQKECGYIKSAEESE